MSENYYDILGVAKNASDDELKKAFRDLSKKYHPDHNPDNPEAEDQFKKINEAYSILSDKNKRHNYDNPNRFSSPFDFMQKQRNAPRRGNDIKKIIDVPLHKIILGGEIELNFKFIDLCQDCGGKGAYTFTTCEVCGGSGMFVEQREYAGGYSQISRTCHKCKGRGEESQDVCDTCKGSCKATYTRDVSFEIPSGYDTNSVIRLGRLGRNGVNGGPSGDLLLKLNPLMPKTDAITKEQRKILESLSYE